MRERVDLLWKWQCLDHGFKLASVPLGKRDLLRRISKADGNSDHAEADSALPAGRPEPVGRRARQRQSAPAAASELPVGGLVGSLLGVVAPLPDVAAHVVQTELIRRVRAHFACPLQVPADVRLFRSELIGRLVKVEVVRALGLVRQRTSATRILPLVRPRQAIDPARDFLLAVQALQEGLQQRPTPHSPRESG